MYRLTFVRLKDTPGVYRAYMLPHIRPATRVNEAGDLSPTERLNLNPCDAVGIIFQA